MNQRIVLALSLAACALTARATDYPTPFNLGRAQDIAARPMALGGSYTAVASDASALYYNPAGLSAVKKHELSLSLERTVLNGIDQADGFAQHTDHQEDLRIQSLAWLLPVPTVRGGLTFAFAYYRPRTFADVISYEDALSATRGTYEYKADGALDNYRAGMGIDIAPDLSFGLALGYVTGGEEIRVSDSGQVGYLRNYNGFNLEPSLMFKISPRLRAGVSLVLWEKFFNLEEVYEQQGVGNSEDNYQVSYPFQVKSGLAYQGNSFLVAADARLNGFSQYRYGTSDASTLEKTGYKDELILSLGAEKFLPVANAMLRAGYTMNTLPETAFDPTYNLHRFSAGVGFLVSGSLALDMAYSYSFWGLAGDGISLDNREHRALLTMAYRY
ncbi:MAG: Long-chain fatty acid transport protein [Fibrobacteres bacterium]|nr:Long-chain fatty acid transport protein [Fibrobacterota bacterium]